MFPRFALCLAALPTLTLAPTTHLIDGRAGLPFDWSHRHVVFPNPASEARRRQLDEDPRYSLQTLRRGLSQFEVETPLDATTPARSAGHTLCFISPKGDVYPCVQFPLPCGNVREQRFADIWNHSKQFNQVRAIKNP